MRELPGIAAAQTAGMTPYRTAWAALCCLSAVATVSHAAGAVTNESISVRDDTAATLTFVRPPLRIVSLAPGATEMLFAIGAGERVVGTSRYSDQPDAARRIPRIGDVAALDYERILALRPDVVIVWQGGNPAAQVARLEKLRLPLYRQRVSSLRDLPASLQRIGDLTGQRGAAARSAAQLTRRLDALRTQFATARRLRVFLQIWDRPLYTVGGRHMMTDALAMCGADSIFPELRGEAPAVSIEAVLARDPDVIVADAPPGRAAEWLAEWRRYPRLRAVQAGGLLPFEDPRFGMLGPSALDATENLCRLLDSHRRRVPHTAATG
jgi:iron complex transport system substrate-binding protein